MTDKEQASEVLLHRIDVRVLRQKEIDTKNYFPS